MSKIKQRSGEMSVSVLVPLVDGGGEGFLGFVHEGVQLRGHHLFSWEQASWDAEFVERR